MQVWFVSRHLGAIEWMKQQEGWHVDHWVEHLDVALINHNDIVIGTLPLSLVADVCKKVATFYALVMPQTPAQRGCEHSLGTIKQVNSHLMRYHVDKFKK